MVDRIEIGQKYWLIWCSEKRLKEVVCFDYEDDYVAVAEEGGSDDDANWVGKSNVFATEADARKELADRWMVHREKYSRLLVEAEEQYEKWSGPK